MVLAAEKVEEPEDAGRESRALRALGAAVMTGPGAAVTPRARAAATSAYCIFVDLMG